MAFDYKRWSDDLLREMEDQRAESDRARRIEESIQRHVSKGVSRQEAEKRFWTFVRVATKVSTTDTEAQAIVDRFLLGIDSN